MMNKFLPKRLKRAALLVLLLYAAGRGESLAQTQVAILQHGEETSAFYGADAFVDAHEAAVDGDIITLSEGTFAPTNITKAITLHGAGCAVDTVAGTNPTIIGGSINLDVSNDTVFLSIEGVLFSNIVKYNTLYNPQFIKCNFYSFQNAGEMQNGQFVDCLIRMFYCNNAYNTLMTNCVVWNLTGINNSHPLVLYNSIIANHGGDGLSAYNSIIIRTSYNQPSSGCSFHNCLGINTMSSSSAFGSGYTMNCINYSSYEEVFESFTGFSELSFEEAFILKDEIATGFLGSDGTQVGIYGGTAPYTNQPSYVVRTQVTVPNRSNNEGKLNVEIEIIDDGE